MFNEWFCWNDRQSISTEYLCLINRLFFEHFSTEKFLKSLVNLTEFFNSVWYSIYNLIQWVIRTYKYRLKIKIHEKS